MSGVIIWKSTVQCDSLTQCDLVITKLLITALKIITNCFLSMNLQRTFKALSGISGVGRGCPGMSGEFWKSDFSELIQVMYVEKVP